MRDEIPHNGPKQIECSIINMATSDDGSGGTHWTAYWIDGNKVHYFDSYGNLEPPIEWKIYFGFQRRIFYNTDQFQSINSRKKSVICGHLCFLFLLMISEHYKKVLHT